MSTTLSIGLALYVLGVSVDVASSIGVGRWHGARAAPHLREGNRLFARADGTFRAWRNVALSLALLVSASVLVVAVPVASASVGWGLGLSGVMRGAVGLRNVALRWSQPYGKRRRVRPSASTSSHSPSPETNATGGTRGGFDSSLPS